MIHVLRVGSHDLPLPRRATPGAAAFDLRLVWPEDRLVLRPGDRVLVPTGFRWRLPSRWYGQIASRSGLALHYGIEAFPGVIDYDYDAEVKVLLRHLGTNPVQLTHGERIAQLLVLPVWPDDREPGELTEDPAQGAFAFGAPDARQGGFGSTGAG